MGWFDPNAFKAAFGTWLHGLAIMFGILMTMEISLRLIGWWTHRKTADRRPLFPADWPANFALSAHTQVIGVLISKGLMLGAMVAGYSLSTWRIPFNGYTIVVYFLAAEFGFYFHHRLSHEIRLFWADHSIHHSSEDYNYTLTYRLPPFVWAYQSGVFFLIAMLGFDPVWLLLMNSVGAFQLFIHTDRIGRLGWFDYVFCSPANHSIHHASNPQYMDKNYGGATVLWDHLLGTFKLPNQEKIRFGITHRVNSANPFKIWLFEFKHVFRDAAHAPTLGQKLVALFGRPGETYEHKGDDRALGGMDAINLASAE